MSGSGNDGWGSPSTPSEHANGGGSAGASGTGGWNTGSSSAWHTPDAKPGVIPLRPLAVGEILDGAITTIRRNPMAMLGLSAIVAVTVQLITLVLLWNLIGGLSSSPFSSQGSDVEEQVDEIVRAVPELLTLVVVGWASSIFLTGMLTVVVGQAVLGKKLSIGQAWASAKKRLLRLAGLTLLYPVIWLSPFLLVLALILAIGFSGGGQGPALLVGLLGFLAAIPFAVWLYVRYALTAPTLMLETTTTSTPSGDSTRPIRLFAALRRSAALVKTSWWRVFGILILITVIIWIITQVLTIPLALAGSFIGDSSSTDPSFAVLSFNTLAAILGTTLTAPFLAGATALLYIDRRIRREGLDIELAQATGVEIPGRYTPPEAGPNSQ